MCGIVGYTGHKPAQEIVIESLKKLDFLVVVSLFDNEVTKLANIVIPSTSYIQKEETSVNLEGRILRYLKGVDAKKDQIHSWDFFSELAKLSNLKNSVKPRL